MARDGWTDGPRPGGAPRVSVVVPMRNEAGNVRPVVRGIADALAGIAHEIVAVDDGSEDGTAAALAALLPDVPALRILRHAAPAGQSAAIHTGVRAAAGALAATLDGDGQNPPSELPRLLAPFLAPDAPARLGLVAGQRVGRRDTFGKRAASRLANGIRRRMLRDGTRDTGCGLKAFRRDAYLALPYFDHMHRYLPALFARDGWEVRLVDVGHAERLSGRSNYGNLQRAVVGASDLLGVAWLIRRRSRAVVLEDVREEARP